MRVYLAGKMGGRLGAEVTEEREQATEALEDLGVAVYDPAKNEYVVPGQPIDLRMSAETMRGFVSKDEYAIRHCDVLLVLTGDTPSEGTGMEFALALQLGKPVVLVSPRRASGDLMGFWNIKASAIFSTIDEATDFIAMNYF